MYVRLLSAQLRSQTQYRLSFAVDLVLNVAITVIGVLVVLTLFAAAGPTLGGLSLAEGLLVAGLAEAAFQTADLVVGNIERLPVYVRTGLLDAVLVRPLSSLGQLLVADAAPRRLGRVAQAAAVLGVALAVNDVDWTPSRVVLVVLAPVCGAVTYASIFVAGATTTFWLLGAGETANAFTYGGRDFATYPTPVYGTWFRRVFGYGLGLAAVAYLPALTLLGRDDPLGLPGWVGWSPPLVAAAWCGIAALAWRFGVRHYRSTGS